MGVSVRLRFDGLRRLVEAERVALANLRPSSKRISIRLPQAMLEELKALANNMDAPYQSLIKIFLAEEERKGGGA